jgi:tetratricopeptide (TPR) repeat protein
VLFNLGVMASYAGHYQRAQEVLEAALRQQPRNVDVLYRLASVEESTRQWENAAMHLAQAAKLDPRRSDVQKLLAVTTNELGALDDSLAAWEKYLELEPNDEMARRERAYTAAKMGKLEIAIPDLEQYVSRHLDDPVGHYELAQAERSVDMVHAMEHLDKAVAIDPGYVLARAARGALYYQEGKPESALPDLEFAAAKQPDNAVTLDRLGQTYEALDRAADAVRVLRRAAELAPGDSTTVLHFARALADAGQAEESKATMDRFRQLGPEEKKVVPAGLVGYLSLTPEQRRADYRARAEKAIHDRPDDAAAELAYLKLMIEDDSDDQVANAARKIAALKPSAEVLADASRALLAADYFALARDLLARTGDAVSLDLTIATFRAGDAKGGLDLLQRIPEVGRGADYYMALAEMLAACGKAEQAATAVTQSLRTARERRDLYSRAVSLFVKESRADEALRQADEASRKFPADRGILLLKATTLDYARRSEESAQLFGEVQNRWPEWSAVWMERGMILASHQRYREATQALQTAIALGARNSAAFYFLADSLLHTQEPSKAEAAILEALQLSPSDPWIQVLAGRVAFGRREYQLAVQREREAIRLRAQLAEAHQVLAKALAALGQKTEAGGNQSLDSTDEPPYMSSLYQGVFLKQ